MNTPARTTTKALSIREELQGNAFRSAIAQVLPKVLTPERFIRVAILAMTKTPKLAECDRRSFFNALLTLSQLGLEPDGRRAHLIPFRNTKRDITECQLIVDYKGLAELVLRSGEVVSLHADVVRENDDFSHDRGIVTRHTYDLRKPRGEIIGAYATAKTRGGADMSKVMTLEEIHEIRDGSQGYKAAKRYNSSSPWDTDFAEMAKKCPFRQLTKWLPLSPEARTAVENTDGVPTATVTTASGLPVFDLGPEDVREVDDTNAGPVEITKAPAPASTVVSPDDTTKPVPDAVKQHKENAGEIEIAFSINGITASDFREWCERGQRPVPPTWDKGLAEWPVEFIARIAKNVGAVVNQIKAMKEEA